MIMQTKINSVNVLDFLYLKQTIFKIKQMIEKNNKANTKFCDLKEVYRLR